MSFATSPRGSALEIAGPPLEASEAVLTPAALAFVASLAREFEPRRRELLARRRARQARFDAGERPHFLDKTAAIRGAEWTVARIPPDLMDRRVEITGPVERKMIINGLNSGAQVFMADFEDATAPTWENVVEGQRNLQDAVAGDIRYVAPETGRVYVLGNSPATLMVRPRGWHLPERHALIDGEPVSASLFDFGLFFFHNVRPLLARATGPYFYLPKIESHLEARLWNDVFIHAQEALRLPRGTIRATVLIETLPAAFEMDEILWELREHSAGLNCGRWDYIFSTLKTLREDPAWVIPDRGQVTMEQGFLRAYTQLLIRTCHRRGIHAMGGMAAQIPIKEDAEANRAALEKVRADKEREAKDGHDGTWVAHPGLVGLAREVFDRHLPGAHQIERRREDVRVSGDDLLRVPGGTRTESGLRHNIRVGVRYLESWLRGMGCVPLYDLMEDAATAEISRTQIWQWIRHRAPLSDGREVTAELFRHTLDEEITRLGVPSRPDALPKGRYREARDLFESLATSATLPDFLTLPAYDRLVALSGSVSRQGAIE